MRYLLLLFAILGSGSAMARSACLANASNADLVDELSSRICQTQPRGQVMATFTCDNWTLNINLLNLTSGQEERLVLRTSDGTACKQYETLFSQAALIATCDNWTLNRVILGLDGSLKQLAPQSLSSGTECVQKARDINNNIAP